MDKTSPTKRRVLGELSANAATPLPSAPAKRDGLAKPHQPMSIAALTASRVAPAAKRPREPAAAERAQEQQQQRAVVETGERPAKKPCLPLPVADDQAPRERSGAGSNENTPATVTAVVTLVEEQVRKREREWGLVAGMCVRLN